MRAVGVLPTIAADAPLREAVGALLEFLQRGEDARPTLAVMDGSRLVGVVTQRDLLMALEPSYLRKTTHTEGAQPAEAELTLIWDRLFAAGAQPHLQRPVHEVMRRVSVHVTPSDPVAKAAWLMIHQDLPVLPVLAGERLVGVLRLKETFTALMQRLLV
jgi:CBS domain-containing protein